MQKDYDKIRERAYEIWNREGRQDGRADEHWLQAERELGGSRAEAPSPIKEPGIPAQAKRKGDATAASAAAKVPSTAQRKRRGSQVAN